MTVSKTRNIMRIACIAVSSLFAILLIWIGFDNVYVWKTLGTFTVLFCVYLLVDFVLSASSAQLVAGTPPPTAGSVVAQIPTQANGQGQVTYVVDQDLVRYVKVAGSFLAIFVAFGVFFFGRNLSETSKELATTAREIKDAKVAAETAKQDADQAKKDAEKVATEMAKDAEKVAKEMAETKKVASRLLEEAKTSVEGISRKATEGRGIVIVGSLKLDASELDKFGPSRARSLIEEVLAQNLEGVLTPPQMDKLKENVASRQVPKRYSRAEVTKLVQADIERATQFFKRSGLGNNHIGFAIDQDDDLMNAYWDGRQVVFGMGMVNSELFGPYESGIVFHEASHSLFDIPFNGESGSVSEHICDTLAVVVREKGWTIGLVRSSDPAKPQYLRSLEAPGTAYDSPVLGKDPQPDSMAKFVKTERDSGGVHINVGILNKAAFLISEGGKHGGVQIPTGIGRENLGRLYVETLKSLTPGEYVSFKMFREKVVKTAERVFSDDKDVEVVRESFKAVGL
jgi:Thermolysin metallopeptidase, alpha-helical domain